jgi:hypothetical protein
MNVVPQTLDLATLVAPVNNRFDARGRQQPTLIISRTTLGAAIAPNQWQGTVAINTEINIIITDIQEVTLLPGDAMSMGANTVNVPLTANLWWRERALEESERT